jgi:hypothetical protein
VAFGQSDPLARADVAAAEDAAPYPRELAPRKWRRLSLTWFAWALSWRARSIGSKSDHLTVMDKRREKFQSASE